MTTAIETYYAGCRFRSRLEARWATFFNHLGIDWSYEPQGYEFSDVSGSADLRYLPDFWLPKLRLWVEVKGRLECDGLRKLIAAAAQLPLEPGAPYRCPSEAFFPWRQRIMVLGEIPAVHAEHWCHTRIDMVRGDLVASTLAVFTGLDDANGQAQCFSYRTLNQFISAEPSRKILDRIVSGSPLPWVLVDDAVPDAYAAATSARFEFGDGHKKGPKSNAEG